MSAIMELVSRFVLSSIGRKVMAACAGVLLCGFLTTHLAGNMFLFGGERAFNTYARVLESNPLLLPIELGLLGIVLLHAAVTLYLQLTGLQARPVPYAVVRSRGGRTCGSRTMIYTALVIAAFLVVHVATLKYGTRPSPEDLYGLVMRYLADWRWAAFYVAVMASLGLHLSHGFWSAFQTFGLDHPKYTPLIKAAGLLFAAAIAGGFAVLPLWACLRTGGVR